MPNKSPSGNPALSNRPDRAQAGCSGCLAWPFALMFLGVGLTFTFVLTILPLWGMLRSQGWVQTPCQIVSSELKGDGDSSQVVVVYTYTFANKQHQSDRYCFVGMSSNTSTGWKQKVVADHPPGKQTNCYVNPSDPTEAVIHRGWAPDMWWMFFPLPFVAVGVGALLVAIGWIKVPGTRPQQSRSWQPAGMSAPRGDDSDDDEEFEEEPVADTGPVKLEPESTPLITLIFAVIFSAFWNGVISVFLAHVIQEFGQGNAGAMTWFLAIFLIPFVLVGIGSIGFVLYSLLALFNPRPTLVVDSGAIPLGEELTVAWHLSGRVSSIRNFKILLKGTEKATYVRGTTTTTDTSVFTNVVVTETTDSLEIEQGSATVTIPADSMHSFDAPNNKIVWTLEVKGDIALWPDVSASFPITVLPQPVDESRESA